ncbi:MAG: ferritin-like domain-containing protein [Alphaproteobacteria bacterium]|nr:ferritin-like domain-containing protein [Alphaproteobacteria bacterium]
MKHWTLSDIPWQDFDASKIQPELVPVIKAASMVEYNGRDYARYLCEVFADDEEFKALANAWADEEVQHGQALRRWAELADPRFDFENSFRRFVTGYQQLPASASDSVRGSRSGELIARCMVETGTSNYYTAIKEYSTEPVLKALAAKIAADELRHYKLFYTALQRYRDKERIGFWRRLWVALVRVAESEDDELAYAYYAANSDGSEPYNRRHYRRLYMRHAYAMYNKAHVDSMAAMLFKAVGMKPHTRLFRAVSASAWAFVRLRIKLFDAAPRRAPHQAMAAG